jgi:hypothetical protein
VSKLALAAYVIFTLAPFRVYAATYNSVISDINKNYIITFNPQIAAFYAKNADKWLNSVNQAEKFIRANLYKLSDKDLPSYLEAIKNTSTNITSAYLNLTNLVKYSTDKTLIAKYVTKLEEDLAKLESIRTILLKKKFIIPASRRVNTILLTISNNLISAAQKAIGEVSTLI